MIMGVKGFD